jgi:protoporphyrinogen oxidase
MGGVHFDEGAHICHSKDAEFLALIARAAGAVVETARSVVRNRWQGCWHTYPVQNNLHELPLQDRVAALTGLLESHVQPAAGEAAHYRDWCLRNYGRFLTETFYDDFTAKYWRVAADELATDWLGGRLLPAMLPRVIQGAFAPPPESQAVFARFRYPARGGFFRFFAALYEGPEQHYGERAVEIDARRRTVRFASGRTEDYRVLASSIPLPDLVRLIKDAPRELLDLAGKLRATQLLCVNLIVDRPRLTDCHWFYVYGTECEAARVSVPSNLAPGSVKAGQTALQAEVFRRDDEPLDPAGLVERTVAQLGGMLGFCGRDVRQVGHVHAPRAYVISDRERAGAVAALLDWLDRRDILSMGLYGRWKYVWSDEAFRQGEQTAEVIRTRLGRREAA